MIDYDLKKIKAAIFDVDGVLSDDTVTLSPEGEPLKTANTKDGYVMQLAQKIGIKMCIITGGAVKAVGVRASVLGIEDIFLGCRVKTEAYDTFKQKYGIVDEEVLYMGDDIPDYGIMKQCGCPCCPEDACTDIKRISLYISGKKGGRGCVRDVLEQVLRAQGKWLTDGEAFG